MRRTSAHEQTHTHTLFWTSLIQNRSHPHSRRRTCATNLCCGESQLCSAATQRPHPRSTRECLGASASSAGCAVTIRSCHRALAQSRCRGRRANWRRRRCPRRRRQPCFPSRRQQGQLSQLSVAAQTTMTMMGKLPGQRRQRHLRQHPLAAAKVAAPRGRHRTMA